MQRLKLKGTSVEVSRIAFGCVGLNSLNDRNAALRLLETAFDAGVTHFDVARLYGSGQAEGILGEFLRGKRDRVTVMTKFGKEPPKLGGGGGGSGLKSMVKWGMKRSGFLKKLVLGAANKATAKGKFDPASAETSLDTSLRELGTDYVDFYMLHDCQLDDLRREETIGFLTQQVAKGRVRAFGATMAAAVVAGQDLASLPAAHACLMFPSNAVEPVMDRIAGADGRGLFTCRPVKHALALAETARRQSHLTRPVAERLGVDPTSADALAALMLRDALARNQGGSVVFSTTKPSRVNANVQAGLQPYTPDQSAAFRELVTALTPSLPKS